MWSDNEADVDLLQFQFLAGAVVRLVRSPHLLPTTIGIYGDWGSGKSSLLKMIRDELAPADKTAQPGESSRTDDPERQVNEGILCLSFSGWLFEGYEDAKTALMGSILESLEDYLKEQESVSDKARELLKRLLKRVNWMQLASMSGRYALPVVAGQPYIAAFAAGYDLLRAAHEKLKGGSKELNLEEVQKLLKDAPEGEENIRRNIRDFHRDFHELLQASGLKCLVVFIDDLDRCLPDTVIETLEAIKLFLFVPGTAFIIGADERLVQYAVRMRFPELPGREAEVGRDYLEKLIQFPVRVPPLSGAEIESYINALFSRLAFTEDPDNFKQVGRCIAEFRPDNLSALAFDWPRARELFGEATPQQLQEDMDLAAQIAPVLAQGLGGNPRRTKRFLNSLLLRLHLADEPGLGLQRRALAKLMVLEEIKPEFFRELGQLQAAGGGRALELSTLEPKYRRGAGPSEAPEQTPATASPAPDEADETGSASERNDGASRDTRRSSPSPRSRSSSLAAPASPQPAVSDPARNTSAITMLAWEADEWMRMWLGSEPPLASLDLRPYFFIAHDRLGERFAPSSRLSPAAEGVLNRLLDAQDFTRNLGLREAKDLNAADALAVFDQLARRLRQAERLDDNALAKTTFLFVSERREIVPQLVVLLRNLPQIKIPFALVPQFVQVVKGTPGEAAGRELLGEWSNSSNSDLATGATNALRRLQAP